MQELLLKYNYVVNVDLNISANIISVIFPERKQQPFYDEGLVNFFIDKDTSKITVSVFHNGSWLNNEIIVEKYSMSELIFAFIAKECLNRKFSPQYIVWTENTIDIGAELFFSKLLDHLDLTPEEKEKKDKLGDLTYEFYKLGDEKKLVKQAKIDKVDRMFDIFLTIFK